MIRFFTSKRSGDEFDFDTNDRIDFTLTPQSGYQMNITE